MKTKIDGIDKYKVEALRLFKSIKQYVGTSEISSELTQLIVRLSLLPAYQGLSEQDVLGRLFLVDLNDCRNLIALEQGVASWQVLVQQFSDKPQEITEDNLIYRDLKNDKCLNFWFATYEEAKSFQQERRMKFLFPYKNTYFVSEAAHIEDLGLDPKDEDWDKIGRDWVKPKDIEAKNRLRAKLVKTFAVTHMNN